MNLVVPSINASPTTCAEVIGPTKAGFKTVGAPGQDIFRGDVSSQTHFFRGRGVGVGSEAPFGGALLGGEVCPALNPALS